MKYFWWAIGLVVLVSVVMMMKFGLKPRVVSLMSPSTLKDGRQFADVAAREMRAYLEQRRIVLVGLPQTATGARVGSGTISHVDPQFLLDFAHTFSARPPEEKFTAIWILGDVIPTGAAAEAASVWGAPIHAASNWKAAGTALEADLKESLHVLVFTTLADAYDSANPSSLANHALTQFSFDQFVVLTLAPVRAFESEVLPPEFVCASSDGPSATGSPVESPLAICATDFPGIVEHEGVEMIKSHKIDRTRTVAAMEQRSAGTFAAYIHSPATEAK